MLGSEKEENKQKGMLVPMIHSLRQVKPLDGINENSYILQEHLSTKIVPLLIILIKKLRYVSIKEREKVREQKRKFSH